MGAHIQFKFHMMKMTTADADESSSTAENATKPNETIAAPLEQAVPTSDAWSEANFQKTENIEKLSFEEQTEGDNKQHYDADSTIDAFDNSLDNVFSESGLNLNNATSAVLLSVDETLSLLRNNGGAVDEEHEEVFNVSDLANLARYRDVGQHRNGDADHSSDDSSTSDTSMEEEEVDQCNDYASLADEQEEGDDDDSYLQRSPQQTDGKEFNFGEDDLKEETRTANNHNLIMTTLFQTPRKYDRCGADDNRNDESDMDLVAAAAETDLNTSLPFPTDKSISPIHSTSRRSTVEDVHVEGCTTIKFSPDFASKMEQKMGQNNNGPCTADSSNPLPKFILPPHVSPSDQNRSISSSKDPNETINTSRSSKQQLNDLGDANNSVDDIGIKINSSLWNVSADGIGVNLDSVGCTTANDVSNISNEALADTLSENYENNDVATVSVSRLMNDTQINITNNSISCTIMEVQLDPQRYHGPPQNRPSPYETTLWQSSDVLLHIVSYVKLEDIRNVMSVNAYTLRCLISNGTLYKVMKHAVRRGKCFGGRVSRGVFWAALADEVVRQDEKGDAYMEYPRRNSNVSNRNRNRKHVMTYQEMLKRGKNGKWTAIINRDVMRAFGTLPPHKTGARAKADSIVRYLTAFGQKNKSKSLDMSSNNLALSVPTDKIDMQYWLGNILYALSIKFSTVGYCQGMDYVVAHLMRTLKESKDEGEDMHWLEEATFHITAKLFKYYNLQHMYWPELRCLKVCCRVLDKLMFIHLPVLADHLDHFDLNVGLFALGWFQTLFLYIPSMPSATVCHIWDIWIVERSFKIFFRVAIAILFLSQPTLLNLDAEGMMTYLNTFPDPTLLNKNILIPCALGFKVTSRMLTDIEQMIQKEQHQKEAGLPS